MWLENTYPGIETLSAGLCTASDDLLLTNMFSPADDGRVGAELAEILGVPKEPSKRLLDRAKVQNVDR